MAGEELKYKFGLRNAAGKYLTMESFGNKVNANGSSLKAKQVWTLEQEDSFVFLKSHKGFYLATDKNGNVTGDNDEKGNDEKFEVDVQSDGRWALKSVPYGRYLSGLGDDRLTCSASSVGENELWMIHLAIHPQVCIKSVQRSKYAHLEDGELRFNELVPWGSDAVISMVFDEGRYALQVSDGRYVTLDGNMVDTITNEARFVIAFKEGHLALRDNNGCYLTPAAGNGAVKKSSKSSIGKAQYLLLEDSPPQGVFYASDGRLASTRQGADVSANQKKGSPEEGEFSDKEIFQLEFVTDAKRWAIRTVENEYWFLANNSGIQAKSGIDPKKDNSAHFEFDYVDGKTAIKASNGKYIFTKPAGHLYATSASVDEKEKFTFQCINRPLLALKSHHGFIASRGSTKLECNRSNYDMFRVVFTDAGYTIAKGSSYWNLDPSDNNAVLLGPSPTPFSLEFQGRSKLCIRAPNGKYLKSEQNGIFSATADSGGDANTLFEF